MKKLCKIVLVSSLSLLCFSCYYDTAIEEEEIIIPPDEEVFFSTDIQPIFNKCTSCHGGNTDPDLRAGNSYNALVPQYVTAGNAETSKLYNYLPGHGHHDIGLTLSPTEIALIKTWIDRGAENN